MRLTEREKLFEQLKDCILSLKNDSLRIRNDPQLLEKWNKQSQNIINEIKFLSDENRQWVESHYKEWYKTLKLEKFTLDLNPFIQ